MFKKLGRYYLIEVIKRLKDQKINKIILVDYKQADKNLLIFEEIKITFFLGK